MLLSEKGPLAGPHQASNRLKVLMKNLGLGRKAATHGVFGDGARFHELD